MLSIIAATVVRTSPLTRALGALSVLALAAAPLLLGACGAVAPTVAPASPTTAPHGRVVVLARPPWLAPAALAALARYPTRTTVEGRTYQWGEDALAALRSGARVDVVEVSPGENAAELIGSGMLQVVDTSRLRFWDALAPALQSLPALSRDGELYLVPVAADPFGIIYDEHLVQRPPRAWRDVFRSRPRVPVAVLDNPLVAIEVAALALGYRDPSALDERQKQRAKDFVFRHRRALRGFYDGDAELARLFARRRITVALGFRSTAFALRRRGLPVCFAFAREGQPLRISCLGVSRDAADPGIARGVIDAYLSLPMQRLLTRRGLLAANREASGGGAASRPAPARLTNPVVAAAPLNTDLWLDSWWRELKAGRG